MGDPATNEEKTTIDPKISGPSGQVIDMIMKTFSKNPWDMDYTGPQVAATNPATINAMDATANAGNVFNMGFDSAATGLPPTTVINGIPVYDVQGMARQGISPTMQGLLDNLWGEGGAMSAQRRAPGRRVYINPFDVQERRNGWDTDRGPNASYGGGSMSVGDAVGAARDAVGGFFGG